MPNLPSGDGQNVKDMSLSVVLASDHDAVPIAASTRWSLIFSLALAAKLIVKATPGTLRALSGRVDSTAPSATYYLQLWNLADVPADATAITLLNSLMSPVKVQHTLGLDDRFAFDFTEGGAPASAGVVLGLSTTEFTKTAAGAYLSATGLIV